ncbi:hypothetical protein MCOR25_004574 [Pyricularia grisea]|nr:hypothetical protein MCOR25_004574 [Pyricularia grisea]
MQAEKGDHYKPADSTCTAANVAIRKEYGDLTKEERLDHVNAVKGLMRLPAKTPQEVAPGAKSRSTFCTSKRRSTSNRWFVFNSERALREECAYKSYQSYWDWANLGGNGAAIPHEGPIIAPPPGTNAPTIQLSPRALAAALSPKGPFGNMTITLGPVALTNVPPGPMGGLGDNPRPLKRDVGPDVNMRFANYSTVLNMLYKPDIDSYRFLAEGVALSGDIGPHGGGRYVIGQVQVVHHLGWS